MSYPPDRHLDDPTADPDEILTLTWQVESDDGRGSELLSVRLRRRHLQAFQRGERALEYAVGNGEVEADLWMPEQPIVTHDLVGPTVADEMAGLSADGLRPEDFS